MSEKKVGKRLLTWVLVLVMTLSLLPLNVLAASPAVMRIVRPDTDKYITYNFYLTNEEEAEPYNSQNIKSGDSLTAPATPEKEGYQFTGWFDQDENEFTDFGTAITVTEDSTDVNLYAKFVPVCYVYFMDGKGTDARIIATETLMPEGSLSSEDFDRAALLVPVSAEQSVIGWTKDNEQVDIVSYVEGGSIYLYPIIANGHWITFDSKGGSYVDPQFVTDTTEEPTAPTKSGYDFAGWYDGDTKFSFGGTLDSNKDLTAHWTAKNAVNYTVIHWLENADDDDYSYKESETLTGTAGELTEDAVDKSYEGFTLDKVEQKEIAGDGSTIVNVYYKRNVYTVTFVSDTERGNDLICGKEEHKHTYSEWDWGFGYKKYKGGCYPSDRYSRNPVCGKEKHSHNRDCYGKLLKEFTITDKYGANISDKWPTYNGSNTWKTSKNGDTYQVNIDTMPLGGATFYGPKTGNGSETAYYYVEVLPGESGTVVKDGVTYKLHRSDTTQGTGYSVTDEDKYPITGFKFKTFEAEWVPSGLWDGYYKYNGAKFYYTRNSYDIVYVNSGAEDDKTTVSYKFEAPISDAGNYKPTTPPAGKEGYEFAGWYDAPTGGSRFDFANKTMPAQNITVYAKWKAPTFTVTVYDVDKKELKTFSNVPLRGTISKADMPTVDLAEGDTFLGWTYEDGTPFNFNTAITKNIDLYARVGNKTGYSVTYVTEGSSPVTDDKSYAEGAYATVRNGPSASESEVFLYWTNNGKKYYPNDKVLVPKGGVTLTAVYGPVAQVLTLTYHSNYPDGTDTTAVEPNLKNNERITVAASNKFSPPNGYKFDGWNTQANGLGTKFAAGSSARVDNIGSNDLYAQWKSTQITDEIIVTIKGNTSTVTYDGTEKSVTGYTVESSDNRYTENYFTFTGTATATGTDAGTYPMGLKPENFENKNANFSKVTFVVTDGSLTITKREVTLTSASDSKVYDGTALTKPE
ncbi:MAG: InlB B-repeat-containing protein, partial [Oscillospiraceae bacterium]|nr:InlB B-repeat-containing protein [Oscillospiraceae bacterium]